MWPFVKSIILFLKFFLSFIYLFYFMGVLPVDMCCLCLLAQCPQKWEDIYNSLELELYMAMSHHRGAGFSNLGPLQA